MPTRRIRITPIESYFCGVEAPERPYEGFPSGSRARWEALIEQELKAPLPPGRPRPFYRREDVTDWEASPSLDRKQPWRLVAERFVAQEVDIWLYDERFRAEGQQAPTWLFLSVEDLPADLPPTPEVYVCLSSSHPLPPRVRPVWVLPLGLSDTLELTLTGEGFPPQQRRSVKDVALFLDQRVLLNAILLRAVWLAIENPTLRMWALPSPHLYARRGTLPAEGPEENLIRATLYALGAIAGGVYALYIPPIGDPAQAAYARWSRNISHLLRYEVGYLTEADPLQGSFYVEAEAQRLAAEIQRFWP